jgi:hypothetical protein
MVPFKPLGWSLPKPWPTRAALRRTDQQSATGTKQRIGEHAPSLVFRRLPPRKGLWPAWPIGCVCCIWIGFHLWSRLTRYRKWRGPQQEQLDGTNHACERAIGWWIKERYRSMRGDIGARACGARQPSARLVRQLAQQRWSESGNAASVSRGT